LYATYTDSASENGREDSIPRGPAPSWQKRLEPVLDHLIQASIDQADGKHHPETGHYATLRYTGCETRERATEVKRALFRCANWMHKHGIASIGMNAEIIKDGNTWTVEFRAVDKELARQHVIQKYGDDPNKWPYFARRKGK
jgi:hypothetical protein